ncbi:MAG: protein kinase, partial [Acidobacteriota bacterium]
GSFEVLGPLGAGGMGEVYRASDTRLGRDVAIKILPEAFAQDPGSLARFEREARLLASVNHPGLAAIYGIEQAGPVRYIVMELVPGETLAEQLARGPLAIAEALRLARQIAEALEAAHERGIVHRDLKPSNIKVTPEGKVKVLDLGLAKAMDSKIEAGDTSRSPTMMLDQTRPGVILGTAEFMSPEQARGKAVDKRTDIWAFGCVLYEMLSGWRVFRGETTSDVLAAILTAEPEWDKLPEQTPPRVRDLLQRCLKKDANERLRDIGDARLELDTSVVEISPSGPAEAVLPRHRSPRRIRRLLMAAGVAAAAVLAGWLLLARRDTSSRAVGQRSFVVLPSRDLSGTREGQLVGDAFVETLSVRLGQLPGVQVVTPTAAVAAADRHTDPFQAAQSVGARFAVRSSFMRNGDLVRITYSVWNVRDRTQVAGGTIDGSASALFEIQDRFAESVTADLDPARKALAGGKTRPTPPGLESAGAQERYLQAIGALQRYDKAASVEEAIRLLDALAAEAPRAALVQAARGRAYLYEFQLKKDRSWAYRAREAAETARTLDPALSEVDVTLGETYLATGENGDAEQAFRRALVSHPGDAAALVGVGKARERAGDFAAAEGSYRKAIARQPFLFAPYNELGAMFAERGRYRDAARVFRSLTELAPDSYRAFSNLGGTLQMDCDFEGAATAYRKALDLGPTNATAASNLGMNHLWRGRAVEAVGFLEKASRERPGDFEIWGNLGDAYRAASRSEDAARAYGRSIQLASEQLLLNARDPAAHSFLATSLARTGRVAEAGPHVLKAIELGHGDPNILLDAAVVAALAGRRAESIEWIRKAVAGGYCRQIVSRQPEFEPLRSDPTFQTIVAAPRKAAGF